MAARIPVEEILAAVDMFRLLTETRAVGLVVAVRFTHQLRMGRVWAARVRGMVEVVPSQDRITHLRSVVLRWDREAGMRQETRSQVVSTVDRSCRPEPAQRGRPLLSTAETSG